MADGNITNEMCNERSGNILNSLGELHNKIDNLDRTVRNGLTERISSHDTSIRIQWYLLSGLLLGLLGLAIRVIVMGVA